MTIPNPITPPDRTPALKMASAAGTVKGPGECANPYGGHMAQWIDQTLTIPLDSLGEKTWLTIGLCDKEVFVQEDGSIDNTQNLILHPKTREEAFKLSMMFRKAAKRFGEIGEGLK